LATNGAAVDVDLAGNLVLVACGSAGVDVFDLADPWAGQWVGNYNSSGLAITLAASGERFFLADWDDVEVVDLTFPASPSLVGWEDTPVRAMGLAATGDRVFVADWSQLRVYDFGTTSSFGDIHIPVQSMELGQVPLGAVVDTSFTIFNTGGAALEITEITTFAAHFEILSPPSLTLGPGQSHEVLLRFTSQGSGVDGTFVRISSLEPDESLITFPVTAGGNAGLLDVGEPAPDFSFPDTEGVLHSLSDYAGQVVVLAFFANW
jgi:hypothetical protein